MKKPLAHLSRRRKTVCTLVIIAVLGIGFLGYAVVLCKRNFQVDRDWDAWTNHLTGPPGSWVPPSNDFQRFYSETQSYKSYGVTYPLSGYKNKDGIVVIEPRFSASGKRFYEGVTWASDVTDGRSGYINPDGSWAIIVSGSTHTSFVGGMGEFQVIGADGFPMRGFVNRAGVEVVPPTYRHVSWYVDGFALVESRTFVGRIADRLSSRFGVPIGVPCLEVRVQILDINGRVSTLPRR